MNEKEGMARADAIQKLLESIGLQVKQLQPGPGVLTDMMDATGRFSWHTQKPALTYTINGTRVLFILHSQQDELWLERKEPGAETVIAMLRVIPPEQLKLTVA